MKKLILFGLIFIASVSLFAQTADKIETEYYGLKWGCSPAELKAKYPAVYSDGENKDGDEIYYLDTNDTRRVFFFGNNKLYMERIVYEDCSAEKIKALGEKISNTYGKFNNYSKGSSEGNEYFILTKQYSSKICIEFQVTDIKNLYGYTVSELAMVTYINNDLAAQIQQDRINKMQDDLEI